MKSAKTVPHVRARKVDAIEFNVGKIIHQVMKNYDRREQEF